MVTNAKISTKMVNPVAGDTEEEEEEKRSGVFEFVV